MYNFYVIYATCGCILDRCTGVCGFFFYVCIHCSPENVYIVYICACVWEVYVGVMKAD